MEWEGCVIPMETYMKGTDREGSRMEMGLITVQMERYIQEGDCIMSSTDMELSSLLMDRFTKGTFYMDSKMERGNFNFQKRLLMRETLKMEK